MKNSQRQKTVLKKSLVRGGSRTKVEDAGTRNGIGDDGKQGPGAKKGHMQIVPVEKMRKIWNWIVPARHLPAVAVCSARTAPFGTLWERRFTTETNEASLFVFWL